MTDRDEQRVMHLADLARLDVASSEVERQAKDFRDVVGYVGKIDAVGASSAPLLTTVSGLAHVLREDEVKPSDLPDALLAVVPETGRRHVRVPAIL